MKAFDHSLEQALIDWAINLRFEGIPEQATAQVNAWLDDDEKASKVSGAIQ